MKKSDIIEKQQKSFVDDNIESVVGKLYDNGEFITSDKDVVYLFSLEDGDLEKNTYILATVTKPEFYNDYVLKYNTLGKSKVPDCYQILTLKHKWHPMLEYFNYKIINYRNIVIAFQYIEETFNTLDVKYFNFINKKINIEESLSDEEIYNLIESGCDA